MPPDSLEPAFAWMFAEEDGTPSPRDADDAVGHAFDDLCGDWSRTGGHLTRADVALLITNRHLSPEQHGELLDLLEEAGVELSSSKHHTPLRTFANGHTKQKDLIGQYLQDISRFRLIDASREVELWALIVQGTAAQAKLNTSDASSLTAEARRSLQMRVADGKRAHAELVCANLRLVVSVAKARHYDSSGVEFLDRVQDGNLGLMHAAHKFDGAKGYKFSTYASWWIRQAIERGIGNQGRTIRVPVHVHERARKVQRAISRLSTRLDRGPTLTEICDETAMGLGEVQFLLDLLQPTQSLDANLGNDSDFNLMEVAAHHDHNDMVSDPAEIVIESMFRQDVARVLKKVLPERSIRIIERRFGLRSGDEETLESIAVDHSVTREAIRQIQQKSLKKLRESEYAASLQEYLIDV